MSTLNNQPVCYGIDMCGGRGVAYYDVNKSPTHGADGHTNAICFESETQTRGLVSNCGGEFYIPSGCISVDEKMGNTYVFDDVGNTLGARDYKQPQAVVYGISQYDSSAMKPDESVYESESGSPTCNQGGMAIVQTSGVVSKGSGECFMTPEKHMSLSVGGGQAGQGYPCICIEGNGSRESHRGNGYKESETMYSLNTVEQHAVCQTYQNATSNQLSPTQNVYATAYDGTQVSPTLTANNAGWNQRMPDKDNFNAVIQGIDGDQGGALDTNDCKGCGEREVVAFGIDCYNQAQQEEVTQPLRSINADSDHIPCVYGLDRASFNQGKNALYDFSIEEEKAQTLVSKGPGGVLARQSEPCAQEISKE